MTHVLDLAHRHWFHRRGPITAIGTWLRRDGRWRPCMVLVRTGEELSGQTVPCIVPMDTALVWSEDIGDPRRAARMAFGFAEALRLDAGKSTIIGIAKLINDLLGDLLSMPPYMPPPGEVLAEVTVTERQTGKSREVELRDV